MFNDFCRYTVSLRMTPRDCEKNLQIMNNTALGHFAEIRCVGEFFFNLQFGAQLKYLAESGYVLLFVERCFLKGL